MNSTTPIWSFLRLILSGDFSFALRVLAPLCVCLSFLLPSSSLSSAETYMPPWPDLTVDEARSIVAGEEGKAGAQLFAGYAVGALNGFYTGAVYVAGSERITCFDPDSVFVTPKELILWAVDWVSAETEAPKESLLGPVILAGLQQRFACAPGEIDLTFREEDLSEEGRRSKALALKYMREVDVYAVSLSHGLEGEEGVLRPAFAAGYVLGSYRILEGLSAVFEQDPGGRYCFSGNRRFQTWVALRQTYLDGLLHIEEDYPLLEKSPAGHVMPLILTAAWVRDDDAQDAC